MEFVSWDDFSIPNMMGKMMGKIKKMFETTNQPKMCI
jgi:hypothetical protein